MLTTLRHDVSLVCTQLCVATQCCLKNAFNAFGVSTPLFPQVHAQLHVHETIHYLVTYKSLDAEQQQFYGDADSVVDVDHAPRVHVVILEQVLQQALLRPAGF